MNTDMTTDNKSEKKIEATPEAEAKLDAAAWKIIGVVILAPFMTQMDSTVVNVSLSAITQDLHSTIESAQWIISAYLLALALMLPITGWVVDRVGAKRLYLFCFFSFTLASFMCGAAHTMNQLIAARIFQGIAGGLLAPLTQLMMVRVAGKQMVKVIGIAAAPILLAPLLGPMLAGAILKYASWPWLFYINLPVGVIAIVLAMYYIPHDESLIQKRPFDMNGFLMISPALVLFLYGFEATSHHKPEGPWVFATSIVLVIAFLRYAKKMGTHALIDIGLFKNSIFSTAAVTQFMANGIMYAGQFLIPLYLLSAVHLNETETGYILSAMGVGMFCIYPFVGNLTDKFGIRQVASTGVVINFLGTVPFLWMAFAGYSMPLAIIGLFLRGFGQGSTAIPSIAAAYASVPKEKLSFATTAINIVQRLGGPVMTTALAIVVSLSADQGHAASTTSSSAASAAAFVAPFSVLIFFQLIVFAATCKLPVRVQHQ
jgi:EmrB/QacA subfamily drug resistance transporter